MRPSAWLFPAFLSFVSVAQAEAATRPSYGGTLRIQTRAHTSSLQPGNAASEKLLPLVFETLVRMDESGRMQPHLAVSWQHDPEKKRLQFQLRPKVKFHDGAPLTAAAVVGALQPLHAGMLIMGSLDSKGGEALVVQSDRPLQDLLRVFALPLSSIAIRSADGALMGTGPFRVVRLDPGRKISLASFEDHWEGRPFLDALEVEMGRAPRDQLIDVELGKADVVEVWPNESRRAAQRGIRIWSSQPVEIISLIFDKGQDTRVREALAGCIDREAIHNVLLQRQGEISGGLLPQWLSGYAFLFPAERQLQRSRQIAGELPAAAKTLTLGHDASDPLFRTIVERIVLNARDAGITLQGTADRKADVRLVRLAIGLADAVQALANLSAALGLTLPGLSAATKPADLYAAERRLLDQGQMIPLFHLPEVYGVGPRVRTVGTPGISRTGHLRLADVWLAVEKP